VPGEDCVAIVDEVLVVIGVSDDLSQLLQRPLRTRMCGDVQVCETTRAVLDDDEQLQHTERGGDRNEEVACEDGRRLVLQER